MKKTLTVNLSGDYNAPVDNYPKLEYGTELEWLRFFYWKMLPLVVGQPPDSVLESLKDEFSMETGKVLPVEYGGMDLSSLVARLPKTI